MIIIRVMGGLGNQMQQYALYEKLKHQGKEVYLDLSWYEGSGQQDNVLARRELELRLFQNLPMDVCTPAQKIALVGREASAAANLSDKIGAFCDKVKRKLFPEKNLRFIESGIFHPQVLTTENAYLEGFWACEKYYYDVLDILRERFVFPDSGNDKNRAMLEEMRSCAKGTPVCVHIRRGDYLDPENAAMFGGICTEAYYEAAINYVRSVYSNPHFYLFSDDSDYLREHYVGDEYTIIDWNTGKDSFYDIQLMSACKANICANSTFSFWGARLNPNEKKIMIRPAKHKNSQPIVPEVMHDLWPGWVLIDAAGQVV